MKTNTRVTGMLGLVAIVLTSGAAFGAADALDAQAQLKKGTQGGTTGAEPSASADPPAKKPGDIRPAGGYSYSDKRATRSSAGTPRRAVKSGPSAVFPAFSATDGGGSRLVVHLSSSVPVEEHKAAGSVTYVMKGVHVARWNDTNPLVTVHFNTPVAQARLVPHGADLHLVVSLRAAAAPTFKVTPGAQNAGASLEIDFPKGDFATPSGTTPAPSAAPAPSSSAAPAPKTVPPAPSPAPAGPTP